MATIQKKRKMNSLENYFTIQSSPESKRTPFFPSSPSKSLSNSKLQQNSNISSPILEKTTTLSPSISDKKTSFLSIDSEPSHTNEIPEIQSLIAEFPVEILLMIFSYLQGRDFIICGHVCRHWRAALSFTTLLDLSWCSRTQRNVPGA